MGNDPINEINIGWVVIHHIKNAEKVAAQAPATVALRQNRPSQKTIPIIGEIFQNISNPFTTPGSQKAKLTPPITIINDVMRPI